MAKQIVRDSKFRHVFGEPSKEVYADLRPSNKASEANGLRVNSKFLLMSWDAGGGGAVMALDLKKTGRLKSGQPVFSGHHGPVLDFEFNPFNENQFVSCSEDLTIKLWDVPDGGLTASQKEASCTLEGHGKKISFVTFNPTVDGIIASSAFDFKAKVWSLDNQEESYSIDLPEQSWSLQWNWQGSLLATTCKDKMMHIIDPRAKALVSSTKIHDGSKGSKIQWVGSNLAGDECNKIITTGFSSQAERQIMIWDTRKFGDASKETCDPLNLLVLDQGTGALYPHWDDGSMTLWITGKGDGNCRYFEHVPDDPHLHFLSQYGTSVPQKAFAFMPKRFVDVSKHELMKGYKLENTQIVPISFKVPRKSEAFQEDIFPDCYAGVPAMDGDKWMSGTDSKNPVMQSMRPGAEAASSGVKKAAPVTMKALKEQLAAAMEKIAALEKENEALKAENAKLSGS